MLLLFALRKEVKKMDKMQITSVEVEELEEDVVPSDFVFIKGCGC